MKNLKWLLIIIIIIAAAVFTGTWIFEILSHCFNFISKGFDLAAKAFRLFGWQGGIFK